MADHQDPFADVVPVEGGGTVNHAWTGGPLTLLSKYVAGIAPTEAAYAAFQVLPQLGELREVSASVPSMQGTISVDIQRGPPFTMNVLVPPATNAVVGVYMAQGNLTETEGSTIVVKRTGEAVADNDITETLSLIETV